MSLFCKHNRYTADCPICAKGTVHDKSRATTARRPSARGSGATRRTARQGPPVFKGPHSGAGPYVDPEGASYTIRLEKVPGGARLAAWDGSRLRPSAPVMAAADLPALLRGTRGVLADRDAAALEAAIAVQREEAEPIREAIIGVSRGRTGDFKEELRVEALEGGLVRIARWVLRPGSDWELQDAPPMLPAARLAQAVADAMRQGLAASGPPA